MWGRQMWTAQYYARSARRLPDSADLVRWASAFHGHRASFARPDDEIWSSSDGGPDEYPELATNHAGAEADQDAGDAQRLPGHGAAMAGLIHNHATPSGHQQPDLLEAGVGVRHHASCAETIGAVGEVIAEARSHAGPVLLDFVVEQEVNVYPMWLPARR